MPPSDFDIETLARYLHLTPSQVTKLADRGGLPARKVGGKWRFSKAEIHHWLERRIGASDEEELVKVEGVLSRSNQIDQEEVSIADVLPMEALEASLNARTPSSVIRAMVDLAATTGWLWDPAKMAEAVRSREEMHPTALENGVALLHPRRPMSAILGQAFVALGRTPRGIPFGGGRGSLTDVFFLICSTDDRSHLRLLARLSRILAAPGFLEALREAPDAAAIHRLFVEAEASL